LTCRHARADPRQGDRHTGGRAARARSGRGHLPRRADAPRRARRCRRDLRSSLELAPRSGRLRVLVHDPAGVHEGLGLHEEHEDRYFILFGELEIVLYNERPTSPTEGLVSTIVLSEYRRRLMNIPAGVWHAERNLGSTDVVVINFPTIPYDHANPDKYRLPLDTDRIPYQFENPRGW
jgi:dTDP-4-dehydrorhamnose 3,5-epimerase-like enzyme